MSRADDLRRIGELLRVPATAAVVIHEDPDLDAVGAAAGLMDLLGQCGSSAALYVREGTRVPASGFFLAPAAIVEGSPPRDAVVWALDSGNVPRIAADLEGARGTLVNIDHHQDNDIFGDLNWVLPEASSVSEMICLLASEVGLRFSPWGATGLYAGISFDSGHFRHATTSARTFRCVAELVEDGADPTDVYREMYERRSLGQLRLWARAVAAAETVAAGRALVALLTLEDYRRCGAGEDETEGIVESLRSVEGVDVAALVKARQNGDGSRASLRSNGFDVSAVAAEQGGGGHVQAAGFSSDASAEEVARWLSTVLDARLSTASSS